MTAPIAADQTPAPQNTAQARYASLETERTGPLQRARECSMLTIPSLIPPEGTNDTTKLPQPYQSVGSRGVNNLAAKLLLALFPPGTSFFRLDVDEFVADNLKKKAAQSGATDPQGSMDTALSKVERAIVKKLEEKNFRTTMTELLKHLIVGGNGLLQILKSGALKFHSLTNYVVVRDTDGECVEIIVREGAVRETLPANALAIVTAQSQATETPPSTNGSQSPNTIWLYTWIRRRVTRTGTKVWVTHQEVVGQKIPGTDGQYPVDSPAWLPLRWSIVSGSHYGRGHVEDSLGDHWSLESLSKSIVELAAGVAKMLWLVDEGGTTQKSTVARAPNNAVVNGNGKDITILQAEKNADFTVTKATADGIQQRLEQAYLQTSSIQRNAERVTAEEIRIMAAELESALGGVYSLLAGELQRPLVTRLMAVMTRAGLLPPLPAGVVSPTIIAGLDGLGRSSDLQKLDALLAGAEQFFGPEGVNEYISAGAYITRRAASLNIDVQGMVRSEEEVQKNRAAAQQQALNEKGLPATIKATSDQALAAQGQGAPTPQ